MSQSGDGIRDKNHTAKIKAGIRRARVLKGERWGRPSLLDKDADLPSRVAELRNSGRSWSEIASELGVSRSSARRLANLCQKASNSQIEECADISVSNRPVSETCANKEGDSLISADEGKGEGIMALMPQTIKVFKELLKKADVERSKRTDGL